jgi:hypothetical protein
VVVIIGAWAGTPAWLFVIEALGTAEGSGMTACLIVRLVISGRWVEDDLLVEPLLLSGE